MDGISRGGATPPGGIPPEKEIKKTETKGRPDSISEVAKKKVKEGGIPIQKPLAKHSGGDSGEKVASQGKDTVTKEMARSTAQAAIKHLKEMSPSELQETNHAITEEIMNMTPRQQAANLAGEINIHGINGNKDALNDVAKTLEKHRDLPNLTTNIEQVTSANSQQYLGYVKEKQKS